MWNTTVALWCFCLWSVQAHSVECFVLNNSGSLNQSHVTAEGWAKGRVWEPKSSAATGWVEEGNEDRGREKTWMEKEKIINYLLESRKRAQCDETTYEQQRFSPFLKCRCRQLSQPEDNIGQLPVLSEWVFCQGQSGFVHHKFQHKWMTPVEHQKHTSALTGPCSLPE